MLENSELDVDNDPSLLWCGFVSINYLIGACLVSYTFDQLHRDSVELSLKKFNTVALFSTFLCSQLQFQPMYTYTYTYTYTYAYMCVHIHAYAYAHTCGIN